MTGQQKIDYLIESLGAIKNRVTDSATMTVGAVGYAALGGTIVDDAFNDALITETELSNYLEAHDLVMNHDYATATNAQELFTQEYQGAMNSLDEAIDLLTDASTEVLTATGIMEAAAAAASMIPVAVSTSVEASVSKSIASPKLFIAPWYSCVNNSCAVVAVE